MLPEEMKNKAIDSFTKRFHCCRAVLAGGQEKEWIVKEEVIEALGACASELAGGGPVCGSLAGGVAHIAGFQQGTS